MIPGYAGVPAVDCVAIVIVPLPAVGVGVGVGAGPDAAAMFIGMEGKLVAGIPLTAAPATLAVTTGAAVLLLTEKVTVQLGACVVT